MILIQSIDVEGCNYQNQAADVAEEDNMFRCICKLKAQKCDKDLNRMLVSVPNKQSGRFEFKGMIFVNHEAGHLLVTK